MPTIFDRVKPSANEGRYTVVVELENWVGAINRRIRLVRARKANPFTPGTLKKYEGEIDTLQRAVELIETLDDVVEMKRLPSDLMKQFEDLIQEKQNNLTTIEYTARCLIRTDERVAALCEETRASCKAQLKVLTSVLAHLKGS